MLKERTIMIFPNFNNMKIIDGIRNKYDPLANKVKPHITLVFPFESEISNDEILRLLEIALRDIGTFKLKLSGFSKIKDKLGNYIFLNVTEGKDEIVKLHKLLYSGILEKFKTDYPYVPHMTVGKLQTKDELELVYDIVKKYKDIFEMVVDTVSVEVIGINEESKIEIEYKLY